MNLIHKQKLFSPDELRGQDTKDDKFIDCKFRNVDFKFSAFDNCTFDQCDFSEANFSDVSFTHCRFPESNLSNTDFSIIRLKSCDFSKALLTNCVFQHLKGGNSSERKRLDLRDCKFDQARLHDSVFVFCNLSRVSFRAADLERVIFEKSDLTKSDLLEANINGTSFENSVVSETFLDMDGFLKFGNSRGFILK